MLFFRLPYEKEIKTLQDNSGEDSVIFVPFSNGEKIIFKGKVCEINNENLPKIDTASLPFLLKENHTVSREAYLNTAQDVINFIKQNKLKKLVLSREIVKDFNAERHENVDLSQTFLNLCRAYPNAFVYFFKTDNECWMGAFSELLGSYDAQNQIFKTMSLAGTLAKTESWTEKEIEEQAAVTEFIAETLAKFSAGKVEISAPYDHISGNIKHLRTDFKTELAAGNLDKLISELHPTPAVLGQPKELCINTLNKFEKHSRGLYAGYIEIKNDGKTEYFVNLRCAKFYRNAAVLYAGGGITATSDPKKEWAETEIKSRAILDNLAIF